MRLRAHFFRLLLRPGRFAFQQVIRSLVAFPFAKRDKAAGGIKRQRLVIARQALQPIAVFLLAG